MKRFALKLLSLVSVLLVGGGFVMVFVALTVRLISVAGFAAGAVALGFAIGLPVGRALGKPFASGVTGGEAPSDPFGPTGNPAIAGTLAWNAINSPHSE